MKRYTALQNWNGTVHYSLDGTTPACGKLATHSSYLAPSDKAVTCQRCLAAHGQVEVERLPEPEPGPAELRARERAARQAARAAREAAEAAPVHPARVHGATRPCGCERCQQRRVRSRA